MSTLINILPYLIGISAVGVLLVLFAGLITMASGGAANDKYANILMRWRVGLQGLTVVFLALLVVLESLN